MSLFNKLDQYQICISKSNRKFVIKTHTVVYMCTYDSNYLSSPPPPQKKKICRLHTVLSHGTNRRKHIEKLDTTQKQQTICKADPTNKNIESKTNKTTTYNIHVTTCTYAHCTLCSNKLTR